MAKPSKTELLSKLIEAEIAANPVKFEGQSWAKANTAALAAGSGMSERTVKTLKSKPPFRYLTKMIDGERTTLIRVGGEATMAEHQAKLLAVWKAELENFNRKLQKAYSAEAEKLTLAIAHLEAKIADASYPKALLKSFEADRKTFKKRRDNFVAKAEKADVDATKKPTIPAKDYGCLRGLITDWKPEFAPMLLSLVVRQWPEFKNAVTCHLYELEAQGATVKHAFHDYPSLTVIRRFWTVGLDLFHQFEQEAKSISVSESNQLTALLEKLKAADEAKMAGKAKLAASP